MVLKMESSVLKKAVFTLLSRVATAQGGLLLSLVIAKLLGADGLGQVTLGLSLVIGGSMVARFGTDQAIVRLGSVYIQEDNYRKYLGLVRATTLAVLSLSIVVASLILVFSGSLAELMLGGRHSDHVFVPFAMALPVYTLIYNQSAWLKAFNFPELAPLVETGSVSMAVSSFAVLGLVFGNELEVLTIACMFPVAALFVYAVGAFFLRHAVTARFPDRSGRAIYDLSFVKMLPDYLLISVAVYLTGWAPVLVLGIFASTAEVGIFAMAYRLAFVLNFVLTAFSSVLAPRFAGFFQNGDYRQLQDTVLRAGEHAMYLTIPIAVLLIVFSDEALSVFGSEFVAASPILVILVVAQLVNVGTGSVNTLLTMTGHQSTYRSLSIQASLLLFFLLLLLVPKFSGVGAAVSLLAATVFLNGMAVRCAYTSLKVRTLFGSTIVKKCNLPKIPR